MGRSAADDDARRKEVAVARRAWKEREEQEAEAKEAARTAGEAPRSRMPPVGALQDEIPAIDDQLLVVGSPEVERQLRHILNPLWDIIDQRAISRFGRLSLQQLAVRRWNITMQDEQPEDTFLTRVFFEQLVNVWMGEFVDELVRQRIIMDDDQETKEILDLWRGEVDRQGRLPAQ